MSANDAPKRPPWLRVRLREGPAREDVARILDAHDLHTVCREAHCPNIHECFDARTATFLIMGDICTRRCRFCAVTTGVPAPLDADEPRRVGRAIAALGLAYAVVTSVDRDDLPDGGAAHFAAVVAEIRAAAPACRIEVLTPDFGGDEALLERVFASRPDVFGFNIEVVGRLHPAIRPAVSYTRSLGVLGRAAARKAAHGFRVKSGFMLGVGEREDDIRATLADLARVPCDIVTIGQYLAPTAAHHPVDRFATPEEFARWKEEGERTLGIPCVFAGPLVRSSYHAAEQAAYRRTGAPLSTDSLAASPIATASRDSSGMQREGAPPSADRK
jgi:lipoyl synthase